MTPSVTYVGLADVMYDVFCLDFVLDALPPADIGLALTLDPPVNCLTRPLSPTRTLV